MTRHEACVMSQSDGYFKYYALVNGVTGMSAPIPSLGALLELEECQSMSLLTY